jgi:RNA polymerase I-specific transcription initiation factor RRN6
MDHSLEFAGMGISITDVDEASASLQALAQNDDEDENIGIRYIAAAHLLHLGRDEQSTIAALYDRMLETWIAPLPAEVSRRVRKHKERLARRIAAEVMLASARVLHREPQTTLVESQLQPSQDSSISMPILSSQPLPGSSSQWMSSQPQSSLPLSSSQPSFPPASTPISSQTPMSSQPLPPPNHTIADPLARLSKHLKFKEDAPSTGPPPENVKNLLAHWQPGADPGLYDWRASERTDRVEEIDEPSRKELEKARRRKARREKKQKRENELMQSQPSSQPFAVVQPPVFPRSSPGPLPGIMGSSQAPSRPFAYVPLPGTGLQTQQGFGPFVAQSQVEPGKFGGRPDKKKKKKGRVSGF